MSLPLTFGLLLAVAALLGVYATWQSLRAAFHAGPLRDLPSLDVTEARRALEDEKAALLGNIRDLAFEHDAGKVSEEDFKREDAALRKRAREVLRLLDEDLDSYRHRADELIREALGGRDLSETVDASSTAEEAEESVAPVACHACGKDNDSDAAFCKKCGANLAERECGECGTRNDADAAFCKKCGARVSADEAEAEEAEAEAERVPAQDAGGANARRGEDAESQSDDRAGSQGDEASESSEDAGAGEAREPAEAAEEDAESSDEEPS